MSFELRLKVSKVHRKEVAICDLKLLPDPWTIYERIASKRLSARGAEEGCQGQVVKPRRPWIDAKQEFAR